MIPGEGVREGLAWRGKGWVFTGAGRSGRGTGPRDGANFATCVVFLSFLTRSGKGWLGGARLGGYPPDLASVEGGGARARGEGARASAPRSKFRNVCVGWRGGTHRSWPGGRGGRPRALIPGEGVREGLAWRGLGGYPPKLAWWTGGQGGGARARGGCKGFGSGGVDGRDTGPRDGANLTCVVFLLFLTRTKRRKMAFFEGCPVGGGGYPPEPAWWTGG